MAYNSNKGTQNFGDIHYDGDPADTQIDFENDLIALKTNNIQRLIVSASAITSSVIFSASSGIYAGTFHGDGAAITGIPAASVAAAGSTTQVQYNNGGALAGSSNLTFDGTSLTVGGLSNAGNTTLGDASGDSVTINAATVDIPNVAAGTDNTVVIYNGSTLLTDEIDSRVWGSTLMDSWTLAGDGGSSQTIANTNTVTIAGGTGLTSTAAATDTVTVALDNTAVTAGSYTKADITVDAQGRLTAAANGAVDAVTTYQNGVDNRVITSAGATSINGEANLTFDGTTLAVAGILSASMDLTASSLTAGGANLANSTLYVKSPSDNSVVAIFKSPSHETILALTGSGQVVVGGLYLDGKFNVTGSKNDKLISLKSDTGTAFYVSGSGDTFVSGNLQMHTAFPMIEFTSSHAAASNAQIGINNAGNILLQNNTQNQHIVLKTNDQGSIKEGFRLDGAVPEVVVNQTSDSLVDFRVESDNNSHMLYVDGSADKIGIDTNTPLVKLDINDNTIRVRTAGTPSSASDFGAQGEIRWDADYIYVCVATDTWKRVAISTW